MVDPMQPRQSFSVLVELRDALLFVLSIPALLLGLVGLLLFKVYSLLVEAAVRVYLWERVHILTGADVIMTHECGASTSNLTFYLIVEGNFDFEVFKELFSERLVEARDPDSSLVYPRLRYCLYQQWGYSFWRKCADFRTDNHIHLHVGRPMQSEHEILGFIEKMHSKKFPSDRPPWMVTAIPLASKSKDDLPETCLLFRVNHSIADGMSFIRVFEEAFSRKRKLSTHTATLPPNRKQQSGLRTAGSFVRSVYRLPSELLQQIRGISPNALYGPEVSGQITIGSCEPLELSVIKKVKDKTQTTVNDVIMSSIAAAFSKFFAAKGSAVPDTVACMMPVAFHDFSGPPELVNRLALVRVDIPTAPSLHPLDRLMAVSSYMQYLKSSSLMPLAVYALMKSTAVYPFGIRKYMDHLMSSLSIVSNVPGFKAPLPLISGQQLTRVSVFLPMHKQTGTAFQFFSLGTKVFYSVAVDKCLLKDRDQVQKLGQYVADELLALDAI